MVSWVLELRSTLATVERFCAEVAMSNRSFEMYEYRQVLVRMRQGDSDRQIAGAQLMGRSKAAKLRRLAGEHG